MSLKRKPKGVPSSSPNDRRTQHSTPLSLSLSTLSLPDSRDRTLPSSYPPQPPKLRPDTAPETASAAAAGSVQHTPPAPRRAHCSELRRRWSPPRPAPRRGRCSACPSAPGGSGAARRRWPGRGARSSPSRPPASARGEGLRKSRADETPAPPSAHLNIEHAHGVRLHAHVADRDVCEPKHARAVRRQVDDRLVVRPVAAAVGAAAVAHVDDVDLAHGHALPVQRRHPAHLSSRGRGSRKWLAARMKLDTLKGLPG